MKRKRPKPRNPVARALVTSNAFHRRVVEDKTKKADNPRKLKHRREPTETEHD